MTPARPETSTARGFRGRRWTGQRQARAPLALLAILLVGLGLVAAGCDGAPASPEDWIEPRVAIHTSEATAAHWTSPEQWPYALLTESLQEAFLSDGTPFVVVTDDEIAQGKLLLESGAPRYPIVISLAPESVADAVVEAVDAYYHAGGFLFATGPAFARQHDSLAR